MGLAALAWTGLRRRTRVPRRTLEERIAAADAVFVGRSTGSTAVTGAGVPQRLYRFTVDQEVKGSFGGDVERPDPGAGPRTAGSVIPPGRGGRDCSSAGSTEAGSRRAAASPTRRVLAEVDKPKGNAIKLLIGILILGGVLTYSILRVRRRDPEASLRP